MQDPKFDEDLKQMSIHVYNNGKGSIPDGWEKIQTDSNKKTGYYAEVYKKGKEITIVYRGTDLDKGWIEGLKDLAIGDAPMGGHLSPGQTQDARDTFNRVKSENPSSRIVPTGHSLGGSLAQIISAETGSKAVTFNAYGTGKILYDRGYKNQRLLDITNYGNPNDPIFMGNKNHQPGTTYVTNTELSPHSDMSWRKGLNKSYNFEEHDIDNMNSLDKSVKMGKGFGKKEKDSTSPITLKGRVSYESEYDRKADILAELKEPQDSKLQKVKDALSRKGKGKGNSTGKVGNGWITVNGAHIFLGK